jgi:hypothetical protein
MDVDQILDATLALCDHEILIHMNLTPACPPRDVVVNHMQFYAFLAEQRKKLANKKPKRT